jgi:ubiquinol-cytochrome c reductase cytochrome b subunit
MRIFKSHALLKLLNSYLVDSPQPSNLSYMWNFGSLLGLCLVIQIITGVTLAMHYNPSVSEAFNSVEHIMRDVNNGWLIRYLHSNTASAFFTIVYLHIGRNMFYGSYKAPRTLSFSIGVIILIVMIATAFLGYVLPYGQMSLWGATVITNLMSAIPWVGQDIVEFIWGGFSVNNATLNRFFSLHFVLPFIIAALALMHLIALHDSAGSGNPLGVSGNYDRLSFHPYFIFKDIITIFLFMVILSMFVFFMPNVLGDSENYVMANPMQTPPSIVPEWYLLPFYAILRSIPNKLLGVIAMFTALAILLVLPFADMSRSRGIQFRPLSRLAYIFFVVNFFILMALGAKHVESPYIEFGQISTALYFAYFIVIIPVVSNIENSLIETLPITSEQKSNYSPSDGLGNSNGERQYALQSNTIYANIINTNTLYAATIAVIFVISTCLYNTHVCDAPQPWGLYFQDTASPQMEGLVELHDNIMFYLVIILFGVGWIMVSIVRNYSTTNNPLSYKYLNHGTFIELIWTITPALILILIAFPSFKLLYLMDEISDPSMAVLAEGHQWYWSYQYPDFLNNDNEFVEFDSYLVPESDLEDGALRMLEVDNRVILPELTHVRFIVTAADVIHSFACPSLGIKCDAYPGRLSQVSVLLNREGVFYGQCSEICGVLHSSMPIVIESVSIEKFLAWLDSA